MNLVVDIFDKDDKDGHFLGDEVLINQIFKSWFMLAQAGQILDRTRKNELFWDL